MQSVSYTRVSSREQTEGYSLDSQQSRISDYAKKHNLNIVKRWEVAESAKNDGRMAFSELVSYLKKSKVRTIILEKIDRVARNFKDIVTVQELIEDYDKEFHFVRENIVLNKDSRSCEKLNFDIQAVLAKNYINNLSDEVKKGMEEKLKQGGWPAKAPVGYRNDLKIHEVLLLIQNHLYS